MQKLDECIFSYRKLLQLMDEDYDEISQALQGDLLNLYRELLCREQETLQHAYMILQKYTNT